MTPHELDRLLAGYATGQLSEAERQQLMQAALDDQAVFDALAAEEPLRELLADPAARQEILASLPPVQQRKSAWWRSPWPWAVAGSLAAGLVVIVLLRPVNPPAALVAEHKIADQKMLEAPAPVPVTPPPAPELRRRAPPKPERADTQPKQVASEPINELKERSNAASGIASGVVGGVVGGAMPTPAAPPPPPAARPAEADAVQVTANAPVVVEKRAQLNKSEEAIRQEAPAVSAFLESPDGVRTRLAPGATVDRGAIVVLEAEGPLQIVKQGGEVVAGIPPGVKQTIRLATDKTGEQRYTLVSTDLRLSSAQPAAAFATREKARRAAVPAAAAAPKASEIFFTVR
jgi:hypothetical protein